MAYIDYYIVLGVSKTATQTQIKKAYRELARKNHPDLNANDENAEKNFKAINEANEVLSNENNRAKYDRFGANWKQTAGSYTSSQGGFSDFFESMFGGSGGSRNSTRIKGQDFTTKATLNLTDVLKSEKRTLTVGGKNHSFIVRAGIKDGQTLTLTGHGGKGINGGDDGDLLVVFRIINDTIFKREGNDLTLKYDLDLFTAVLGGEITIETLTGKVKINIKPETQNGERVNLKGKGMPFFIDDRQFGNLIVTFNVKIPKNLTDKEKGLFNEIAQLRSK